MKIRVEDVNKTRKNVIVSVEASEVDQAHKRLLGRFSQQVRIPGFRPGKAPASIILRRYGKEVAEELEQAIKSDAYGEVVEDDELRVCAVLGLEAGVIQVGKPVHITFLVDIEPEISLPDYEGIAVTVPTTKVTSEDVERVLYSMRSQIAKFNRKDGPVEESDYVQVSYEGTLEGRPLEEVAPDTPLFTRQSMTWEEASAERGDFPELAEQLIGLSAGDEKEITVDFAEDFDIEVLRGKSVQYAVKVAEVREKILPPLDEEFLQIYEVDSVEALQEYIRRDLVHRTETEKRSIKREQIVNFLLDNTDFDLPQSEVEKESKRIFQSLLEGNRSHGEEEDEDAEAFEARLWEDATHRAVHRVKLNWIIRKIAEIEEFRPETEDMQNYIFREAVETRQRPEKVAKGLQKDRDRLHAVREFIQINKTLDFLIKKSSVVENEDITE